MYFVSSKYDSDSYHTIIDKFYVVLKEFLLSLGLVSTNLKCVMDTFFKNEFTASIKKIESWPRDTQNVIFLFYFWVENMLCPNIWDCLLNPILNTVILKVVVWLRGIASVPLKHPLRKCFGSNTVKFSFFMIF